MYNDRIEGKVIMVGSDWVIDIYTYNTFQRSLGHARDQTNIDYILLTSNSALMFNTRSSVKWGGGLEFSLHYHWRSSRLKLIINFEERPIHR